MGEKRLDLFERWQAEGEDKNNLAILTSLSMQGKTMDEIGAEFDVSGRQLRTLKNRHTSVSSALKKGRQGVVANAQGALMTRISAGDTAAIIYALKVYGGEFFRENTRLEVSGNIPVIVDDIGRRRSHETE